MPDNFVHYQITNFFLVILICYFLNGFCIFFACITFFNIICSYFSSFFFNNSYYCYFTIFFYLLIYNTMILNKINQLLQIFFTTYGHFLEISIFHVFCKNIHIFHNNISVYYIKFQVFICCAKLWFFIGQTIYIFI